MTHSTLSLHLIRFCFYRKYKCTHGHSAKPYFCHIPGSCSTNWNAFRCCWRKMSSMKKLRTIRRIGSEEKLRSIWFRLWVNACDDAPFPPFLPQLILQKYNDENGPFRNHLSPSIVQAQLFIALLFHTSCTPFLDSSQRCSFNRFRPFVCVSSHPIPRSAVRSVGGGLIYRL